MSGHSKWSTIKHKKALLDNRRGQVFTKLAKGISVAAKEGGADLETNFKLRLVVEKAKQFNMPKKNIDRAIEKGAGLGGGDELLEALYEGYGPGKIAVMVEVVTDNKNRAVSEIKKMFEKNGGVMGQPGSVGFLFKRIGRILVKGTDNKEEQMLKLIDLGAEDIEEAEGDIEILIESRLLGEMKNKIEEAKLTVKEAELIYHPSNLIDLDENIKAKAIDFLKKLDEMDDVQNIFTNLNL